MQSRRKIRSDERDGLVRRTCEAFSGVAWRLKSRASTLCTVSRHKPLLLTISPTRDSFFHGNQSNSRRENNSGEKKMNPAGAAMVSCIVPVYNGAPYVRFIPSGLLRL